MRAKFRQVGLRLLEPLLIALFFVLFCFVIFPMIVAALIPGLLWRYFCIVWMKVFRKDVIKIMGGMNTILAIDDMYGRPLSTIVLVAAFESGMTLDHCVEEAEVLLGEKDPKRGTFVYDELRRYYVRSMGFFWYKHEQDFQVRNHLKYWDPKDPEKVVSEEELLDMVSDLEARPFVPEMSPWELFYVKCDMKGADGVPKALCIYRFHHGLTDGVSLVSTFMKHFIEDSMDKMPKELRGQSPWMKLAINALTFLQLPYQFFRQIYIAWDFNDWHMPERKLTRKMYKAWSDKIPVDAVKDLKSHYGVGFTTALVGAVGAALQKMMLKQKVAVPEKMHALAPFPWPGRPNKICNHWSFVYIPLAVGASNHRERLRKTEGYLSKLKRSTEAYSNFTILRNVSVMPLWFIELMSVNCYLSTITFSNFPGPSRTLPGPGGYNMIDTLFSVGPTKGNRGIIVDVLSYNGSIRVLAGADHAIMGSKELVQDFVDTIKHELVTIKSECSA